MGKIQTTPVLENQRAEVLDIIRGFALLGICLGNYFYSSLYIFQPPAVQASFATAGIDNWLSKLSLIFVTGKFYSIFSLLFGIGFSIIFLRNQQIGKNGLRLFYRRLFILFIIGLGHSFLLWDGDILVFYAIVGLLLPLFRKCTDKTLLITAGALLLSPLLFDLIKVWTNGDWSFYTVIMTSMIHADKQVGINESNISNWLIVHDRYVDLLNWCRNGSLLSWLMRLENNRVPKVLALFLIGLYVGRKQMYAKLEENKKIFKQLQKWGFVIGIPAGIAMAWFEIDGKRIPQAGGLWDTASYAFNVVPLALAYTSTLALMYLHVSWRKHIRFMRFTGRMALTNYILQSAVGVFLFWGIGLGIGAKIGPAIFMPIAIFVWIIQNFYSRLWLKYYNYGPLEWVWRMMTYGKYIRLKKKPV